VHGIKQPNSDRVGCVAVGDTFLFSSCKASSLQFAHFNSSVEAVAKDSLMFQDREHLPLALVGDAHCLTHPILYYHALPGGGIEERNAQRLLACCRNPLM
jgi:hypothetical protein